MTHFTVKPRLAVRHNIKTGPSKFELLLALFDSRQVNTRKVEFRTDADTLYDAVITSVEREDGSGESWNIRGYLSEKKPGAKIPSPSTNFEGYFRTDTRKGSLKFA